jgi:hypothetical protein
MEPTVKPINRPNQDEDQKVIEARKHAVATGREPGKVHDTIADADKIARTGSKQEPVRNTPPAGDWNDASPDDGDA